MKQQASFNLRDLIPDFMLAEMERQQAEAREKMERNPEVAEQFQQKILRDLEEIERESKEMDEKLKQFRASRGIPEPNPEQIRAELLEKKAEWMKKHPNTRKF